MALVTEVQDVPVLNGPDLVARLRGEGEPRPEVDPGLAGGLPRLAG